jgi:hypothetical protein
MRDGSVYSQIFDGVQSEAEVRQAIARAVRVLREAMEKDDNCAVTAAHMRNLADISPEALARGYALAEQTCTFWPTPGQIRELAGWSTENRAGEALQWLFAYLRSHGVNGHAGGGGVHFGEDGTGRRVLLRTDPVIEAPPLSAVMAETLTALGNGTVKHGLQFVSQHPVVKGWDEFTGDAAARTAERIETRWNRSYLQALRRR